MTKLIGLLLLGGIYLLVAGGYDIFIQAGSFKKPDEISIAELEQDVPWNRHLVLTGGRPVFEGGVVYYSTRRSQKIDGSEVYFIPIQDGQLTEYRSLTPTVLLRMTEAQIQAVKNGRPLGSEGIQGIRMTGWELKNEAEDLLADQYGRAAVKKMVIIDYEKAVRGVWPGFGRMVCGIASMAGSFVVAGRANRRKR